jgi:hypothetical protein
MWGSSEHGKLYLGYSKKKQRFGNTATDRQTGRQAGKLTDKVTFYLCLTNMATTRTPQF